MLKTCLVIVLSFILSLQIYAQETMPARAIEVKVEGKVVEARTGEPIPGANVYVKETMRGGITNINGEFGLVKIDDGQTIVISCIGCKDALVKYNGQEFISVELEEDVVALSEVVTVGYGVQERRDLTGAVAKVSSEEIAGIAPSFDNALVGKVAGVNINLSSGAPGSATAITIRGLSSINADNNPLIVIDGVPVYGTGKAMNNLSFDDGIIPMTPGNSPSVAVGYSFQEEFERNPLAALNPDDIESIEILKDAYSTAIYGSRGAAGVILVTTKKGKKGKPQIKIGHSVSLSDPIGTPETLNGSEYTSMYTEISKKFGDEGLDFSSLHNTDWLEEVLRTGLKQETNVSVSGGTDKTSYYISFNRYDEEGYILNQDLLRNSVRTNFNFSPADWISFGVNSSLALVNNEALNSQQIYREAVLLAPNLPIYNPDGSFFYNSKQNDVFYNSVSRDQGNPVALAHEENYVKDTRIISNYYAELKPVSWLRLKTEFGLDVYNSKSYNRQYEKPSLKGGSASAGNKQNIKYVINNVLSFRKMFDKHMVNAILGQSFERSEENSMRVTGDQFFDDNEKSIQAARRKRVMNAIEREWAVVSYFTRINYRFNDRYLAGFTYRVDGSSRFSKNERYRGFPSFSAGWILNEESFMSNTKHWLNDLKLRASYGLTGLDGSFGGYYGNQGVWTRLTASGNTLNYNDVPLLYNEQPVNPNLEWETSSSLDLGLDAVLFDNKLELTLDYFHKQTKNLLASDYVPLYMGWSTQQQNIGDMKSEGIELSVNGTLLKTKDWNWTGSFNISHITDKLTKLNEQGYQMMRSSGIERKVFVVGESLNQFYMYDWVKVDPQTGDPLWRYGDGSIQSVPPQAISSKQDSPLANRYASGSSMPDFYGGFTSNLVYKNWELNATFSYSLGQKMFNGTQSSLMTYHLNDRNNLSTDILDYWKIPGHKTGVPRLDNATTNYQSDDPYSNNKSRQGYDVSRLNDRFLEDASYLRLRTVTLSYTFNQNWVKKLYMDRVRVYGQAMNLLTITGYSGIDPEVNAYGSSAILGGYDEITLPQAKSFKFGVDISF